MQTSASGAQVQPMSQKAGPQQTPSPVEPKPLEPKQHRKPDIQSGPHKVGPPCGTVGPGQDLLHCPGRPAPRLKQVHRCHHAVEEARLLTSSCSAEELQEDQERHVEGDDSACGQRACCRRSSVGCSGACQTGSGCKVGCSEASLLCRDCMGMMPSSCIARWNAMCECSMRQCIGASPAGHEVQGCRSRAVNAGALSAAGQSLRVLL